MKKGLFLIITILLFCIAVPLSGKTLEVRGEKYEVEIPADMTAEDAFYEAFALYLEAEADCKTAIKELENVNKITEDCKARVEAYEASVSELTNKYEEALQAHKKLEEDYTKLNKDHEALIKDYKILARPVFLKGYAGVGVNFNEAFDKPLVSLKLGGTVFEKVSLVTNIEYDLLNPSWHFGVSAGLSF